MLITSVERPGFKKFRGFRAPNYVIAELRYDSGVAISAAGFRAPASKETEASSLNTILEQFSVKRVGSHFGSSARALRTRSVAAPSTMPRTVSGEFAQSGIVQIVPRKAADVDAIVERLNEDESIWKAFKAPQPVPAVSPNIEPCQGYLCSAPTGIDAPTAWESVGGQGERISVCDIEGDWNFDHEDLPRIMHLGGDLLGGDWRDHGTAVLGEIVGKGGTKGMIGIAPKAKPKVHSAVIDGLWNTARAINDSADRLRAGDVILIELQGTHETTGQYVAMQYWDDVYSAIKVATSKGITVVEAAGNGDQNFQAAVYNGTNLQKDSGAIVVGAGVPVNNYYDFTQGASVRFTKIGVPRSRCWFSNYGKIVIVQGWGEHVTTTGYGDAQAGPENERYTHRFSGTSSASPIVTGAVACLQGIAKSGGGTPFTPAEIRKLLEATGSPQTDDPDRPKSQKIGPLPNLAKAIKAGF